MYTEKDILTNLDDVCFPNPYKFFPKLDDPIAYPISSRIHLYGDSKRWSIVFEITNYSSNGYNVVIDKYYFGNCVNYGGMSKNKPKESNHSLHQIVSENDLVKIMNEIGYVKKDANIIVIRNKKISISHNVNEYLEKNIKGFDFESPSSEIDIVALLRLINENNQELFHATESDLKQYLPSDIPKIMTIDKWHHKNYQAFGGKFIGDSPSSYETFQQIAKVLITKNTKFYNPTLPANNDWRYWPKAGNY